jgi:hypothetical protein
MATLLVLSPFPTHPASAGNRARLKTLLELYEENGVDFHIAFFRHERGDEAAMAKRWNDRCTFLDFQKPRNGHTVAQRVQRRLAALAGRTLYLPYTSIDAWRSEALMRDVRDLASRIQPSAVQVTYVFFSHLFDSVDRSAFRILDTQDVVADRHRMFLERGRQPQWFSTSREQEMEGIRRADCVVAIQPQEEAYFSTLTSKPVRTVGHCIRIEAPALPVTDVPTVTFIASDNFINRDAYEFLAGEIWPRIRASLPSAVLEVYGRICAHANVSSPGITLRGEIDDVAAAYQRAWVVVCPLRFGTGLKIKSIEALGHGKALVSTTHGVNGLESSAGDAFLCGDSAEDFAEQCVSALRDVHVRSCLEHNGHRFAQHWNRKQRAAFEEVIALAGLGSRACGS